ncbi:MAG TPA: protein kinase [Oculatellaceae cyanobacterium]
MQDELQKSESLKSFSLFGAEDPLLGKVLDGRWKLTQFLGEGSMSRAYKAEHLQTGEFVVLKMLHKHVSINTANIRRFDGASREVMSLRHPRIAKMLDIHLDSEGEIFLVMEYLPGESLEELLAKVGHLPVHRVIEIFSQVCDALEVAHEDGFGHRDIKPSNIMLLENNKNKDDVKLVDFGITKLTTEEDDVKNSGYITRNKEVMGSPMYMSPEQCMGKRVDLPADIYSLGCVIYESLTGKPPFVGKNVLETAYKHMNEAPKPIAPDASHDKVLNRLESVIFKCLAKDPNERYQSASQVKSDLAMLSGASEADWQTGTYLLKKSTKIKKRKKAEVREKVAKPSLSIEMIALLGALGVICIVAIIWIVAFLNSDTTEGPVFNNDELWKIKDKSKQQEQPDFAGQEDSARTEVSRAERDPGPESKEYATAMTNLAKVYLSSTHYNDAQSCLTKLIPLYPKVGMEDKLFWVHSQLAYAYFMLNNPEAEKEAKQAVELIDNGHLRPEQAEMALTLPLQILGQIYSANNNLPQAEIAYYRWRQCLDRYKAKAVMPFCEAAVNLADIYRRENKLQQAQNYYREGILCYTYNTHQGPNQWIAKAKYGYALTLTAANRLPEAENEFKDALGITRNVSGEKGELYAPIKKQLNAIHWKTNFWQSLMQKFTGDMSN